MFHPKESSEYNKKTVPHKENGFYLQIFECKGMAERMGFEPMWACTLTVFKTAPL
jgi:hypothetical protein